MSSPLTISEVEALQPKAKFYISGERRREEYFNDSRIVYVQARKGKSDNIIVRLILDKEVVVKPYARILVRLYTCQDETTLSVSTNPRYVSEKPIIDHLRGQLFFPLSPVQRDSTNRKKHLSSVPYYLILIGVDVENKEHMLAASCSFTIKSKEKKSQNMRAISKPHKKNTQDINKESAAKLLCTLSENQV